jgi:hypothetical protein
MTFQTILGRPSNVWWLGVGRLCAAVPPRTRWEGSEARWEGLMGPSPSRLPDSPSQLISRLTRMAGCPAPPCVVVRVALGGRFAGDIQAMPVGLLPTMQPHIAEHCAMCKGFSETVRETRGLGPLREAGPEGGACGSRPNYRICPVKSCCCSRCAARLNSDPARAGAARLELT